ncbi:MAG: hypothetical protein JXA69_03885 [Phycisphaerae bacterium]|nr:hypothetical protein [Phycisphaerae bacterium]
MSTREMTRARQWHRGLTVGICLFAAIGLTAPTFGVSVIPGSQAPNATVIIGMPFNQVEFEDPLTGNEMVKKYGILEWLDADYTAGNPPDYEDWSVNDPANIDGNVNEVWMRQNGHKAWTSTTVSSYTVSIHLIGDSNDGLAEVFVDGVSVVQLDMGTAGSAQTAVVIVDSLGYSAHNIQVDDLGVAPSGMGTDVAVLGAAALEKRIKWNQPPEMFDPGNVYYGWNEFSVHESNQIAADDWACTTEDPVTDVHWWGSYIGWKPGTEPPETPSSFVLTIWTDVPAGPVPFSHPGQAIWQIETSSVTSTFVGWDYDPRTQTYEGCFRFDLVLQPHEYFYQEPGGPAPNIYWLSIAAKYPTAGIPQYPWGWKTRPREANSLAPDVAVRIFDPTAPLVGSAYVNGSPIQDMNVQWDLAFELTARSVTQDIKYEQPPEMQGGPCFYGWDEPSVYEWQKIVADDWPCNDERPISDIHWWGSYVDWQSEVPPLNAPDQFHIAIWTDVPAGVTDPWSHPGQVIWEMVVPRSVLNEHYVGCDQYPGHPLDACFRYDLILPQDKWFYQDPGEHIYWLSIAARYSVQPPSQFVWGWKTRPKMFMDDAVRIFNPTAPVINSIYVNGQPIEDPPGESWDTAFMLTTVTYGEVYVKWSQRPVSYTPDDAINGWDEYSVYEGGHIVADDWFCNTEDPVTDVHWWGSFIGWYEPGEPPLSELPEAFQFTIWTDVPAGEDKPWSHPGVVIWEHECRNFTWEFVGWDFDPRDPAAPPEACFKFEQDIPEDQWFYQEPGDNIYWISIAAKYPAGTVVQYPWGWKSRPRDPNSLAPDDAVRIFDPTAPILGDPFLAGEPIWWPTEQESWDMAFALTTKELPPPEEGPWIEFSLDIGSDKELSDPLMDGDEAFDPGDVYWWQGAPVIPPGRDGFKDDLFIFGLDPNPNPPDGAVPPATRVPVGSGSPQDYYEYFDLDGHDQVDESFIQLIPEGPVPHPIAMFPSMCIHPPTYLLISMDDDQAPGWPANDVPVMVPSPANRTYGSTAGKDEVSGVVVNVVAGLPPYAVNFTYPYADELTVHQSLAPNPDAGDEEDDDVDSLDIVESKTSCPIWLFTADHEANWNLDPGSIYQAIGLGMPVKVIDQAIHLGLRDDLTTPGMFEDADVDAFEMVWLESPDGSGLALAILFSVDEDDPITVGVDESGGLDPRMVYYSFLNGVSQPFLQRPLYDDVDGLTVWTAQLENCYDPVQDSDGDGDVDLSDFGQFSACFNGPNRPWSPTAPNPQACSCFDQDDDGDVDLTDFGVFSSCFNGPNRPPAPGCP